MRPITDDNSLIEWLEKQPPEGVYYYPNGHSCLLAQYFKAMGLPRAAVSTSVWWPEGTRESEKPLPLRWDRVAGGSNPTIVQTFGAALARAKELLSH